MIDAHLMQMRDLIIRIDVDTLILTHEVLLGWPFGPPRELIPQRPFLYPETKRRLIFLSRLFEGLDVQAVYYIRDQAAFLESFYIQSVQAGATYAFEDWISHIDLSRLSWRPIIDAIRAHFPICVKRFETEYAYSQSDAVRRFLAVAAPSISADALAQISFEKPINRSLNATGISIMTEMNKLGFEPEQRNALRRVLQRYVSNLGGERPSFLSEAQNALLAEYHSENEALAA
jgi:hypothetical protein